MLSLSVFFYAGPEGCVGRVSCTVRSNANDEAMSDITVTLNDPPPEPTCVESYNFSLANKVKRVYVSNTFPSATFTIERALVQPYLEQKIYTYDQEEREGSFYCSFSITSEFGASGWLRQMMTLMLLIVLFLDPNQIDEISSNQICDKDILWILTWNVRA